MKILLLCLIVTLFSKSVYAGIGEVILQEGNSKVQRKAGGEVDSKKQLEILSYDTVKTGQGKTAIQFVDDTRVDVTAHSKLLIDEFVFDASNKTGKLSIKATAGTVRYASGQIAKNSQQNVKIETPTATIGVRGTDFSMTIDEIGGSTIILLPSCDKNGYCFVGEISVESDVGQVILNQAFQATVVTTSQSKPLNPLLLKIDETLINNMLIVSKPKEIANEQSKNQLEGVATALDLDFLKFEGLNTDFLKEDSKQFSTMLDVDFLDQNFLDNVLDQLNKEFAKQIQSEFEKEKTTGAAAGRDNNTGIILLDDKPSWIFTRDDGQGNNVYLKLDQEHNYKINLQQNDFQVFDYTLGGSGNVIYIKQSSR
jgi:hypothetical protein